jgi:hypothetical protein
VTIQLQLFSCAIIELFTVALFVLSFDKGYAPQIQEGVLFAKSTPLKFEKFMGINKALLYNLQSGANLIHTVTTVLVDTAYVSPAILREDYIVG